MGTNLRGGQPVAERAQVAQRTRVGRRRRAHEVVAGGGDVGRAVLQRQLLLARPREVARQVVARRPLVRQEPHALVGARDQLRAEGGAHVLTLRDRQERVHVRDGIEAELAPEHLMLVTDEVCAHRGRDPSSRRLGVQLSYDHLVEHFPH